MSDKNQSLQNEQESAPPVKKKKISAYDEPFGIERTPFDVESAPQSTSIPMKGTVRESVPPSLEESAPTKEAATEEKKAAPQRRSEASARPAAKKTETKKKKSESDAKVHASTASPKRSTATMTNKKEDPQRVSMDVPRSARPAHQVIPFILIGLSIFVGISLILNIFCNWRNVLGEPGQDPGQHWMGIVGYYICYVLFGLFGPAVFALPFLLLNLGIYWKRYIDHKLAIKKIIATLLFIVMLASVIHVFCLIPLNEMRDISAADLMLVGAKMNGGGVIGGKLGYLLYSLCNFTGSLIIEFLLLIASLFYFLGMTPQYVWSYLRNRRQLHAKRSPSYSEQSAEEAGNRAKMEAKIRRTTSGQASVDDEDFDGEAPLGAVRVIKTAPVKRTNEDKMAPMPMPRLDPNDGEGVFVPDSVGKKMAEMEEEHIAANTVTLPKGYPNHNTEEKPIDPLANKDAAVEPIFPKTADNRQARRVPRADRSFDLKNIFVDLDDKGALMQRKHAPVPPEVPLNAPRTAATRPAQGTTAAAPTATPKQQRPASPAAINGQPPASPTASAATKAQKPQSVSSTLRPPAPATTAPGTAPAAKTAPGSATQKPLPKAPVQEKQPVFHKVTPEKKDFGLTNEEFERLEAQQVTLPRAGAKKTDAAKPAAPKTAGAASAKPDAKTPVKAAKPTKPASKRYIFPPISYLHPGEPLTEENQMELNQSRAALASTLKSFHVGIEEDIRYAHGPTVTRYEITPLAGVRVRTITNLSDDIALALRASGGIRIEAPIPGTNAVGIEVPNKTRSTIYLRELIESKEFTSSKNKLTACLGAGIANEPLIFDIAKMPHLLIAGTTGSGKSVCINCIIMSLLYKAKPDEVKLVMIDPKKVEFSIYKNIPHLMAPVVTTPKDAAGALQACVEEMERRFELFEQVGVRDLKGYSAATADDPDMPKLPYIVIIIDELADLMMTARDEVETAICRIAQKARAAGMHLIIGTQRPSADVVTGLIKSNVPSRIAFAVKSQVDSRVILDHIGAEALTGRGDMLFVPIGSMRDTRVQGAFVDDKEVEKICEFIRATNGTAEYDEKFITKLKELAAQCGNKGKASAEVVSMGEDGDKAADSKYADAVRIAIEEKRISTSLLQRKLEIGYSRAAKLIDRMQSEGYVSPPDGSKPRTILITAEEYMAKFVDNPEGGEAE